MADSEVILEVRDAVAWITLNRPSSLNAMNVGLVTKLCGTLKAVAAAPDVVCVVISGSGRAFCAGGDLNDDDLLSATVEDAWNAAVGLTQPLQVEDKIFIAAINGSIAGGALGLAMAADLRIASDAATFSPGYARLGLSPDYGTSYYLARAVGYARAVEFLLLGHRLSAAEAKEVGIVQRVVPADQFRDTVAGIAQQIGDLAPQAIAATKRILQLALEGDPSQVLRAEAEAHMALMKTEDYKAGLAAFLERREPVFTGQ